MALYSIQITGDVGRDVIHIGGVEFGREARVVDLTSEQITAVHAGLSGQAAVREARGNGTRVRIMQRSRVARALDEGEVDGDYLANLIRFEAVVESVEDDAVGDEVETGDSDDESDEE